MADRRRAIAAALPVSREAAAPAPMVGVRKKVSEPIVSRLVALADGAAILGTGLVVVEFSAWPGDWRLLGVFVLFGTVLAVNFLHLTGAYRFARFASLESGITRVLAGWFATFAALFLATHIFEPVATAAGSWTAAWLSAGLAALMTIRLVLFRCMERWAAQGRLGELVAVVGAGPIAQRLLRSLHAAELPSLRVVGVYDDEAERLPSHCMGHPILGTVDTLIADARRLGIGTIMVAQPLHADRLLVDTLNRLSEVPADVRLCPDEFGLRLGRFQVSHLGGLTFLNVIDRPLRDWKWIAKTVEDRVLGALILLLISPLLALVAVLIKLDSPGPVFFRQKRYGFNNELIEVLKFRTMYVDQTDSNAEQLTRRDDPRITRIGRFLRRTSIDELPQFINVLRGEMSIVGPRPHALRAKAGTLLYQEAVKYYDARHRMKPGITGWAQVNGWRGETDTVEQIRKRVEHDLYYIEHWSIALDLRIIVRTILGGFTGAHAF
ncbi:MAG TPA: undecaprenyl-phosphate glucose phosphotransferase [Reyranellaceae bacterium]|nr:undecaprenyl-phosphate glucose phosphotransferase [Reyranellaceae bacterium]